MKFKLLLLILSFSIAKALVVTDGTVGSVVTLDGADVTITQDLGTTSGNNLFHSFKTFDIDSGNKVTFTGSDTLENVISRVTGGEISTLDGTLKSNIANANFYFFNPAGIVIGPNASIDVPASLHISTADYLTLENGDIFSATNPNESTLGIAKPEAFGYLDREATSLVLDGAQLSFTTQDIELSSGDIEMKNSSLLETTSGNINMYADNIILVSTILDSFDPLSLTSIFTNSGNIKLIVNNSLEMYGSSRIFSFATSSADGGNINLRTKNLLIDSKSSIWDSGLLSETRFDTNAGDITIDSSGLILIYDGAKISSKTKSNGNAGDIGIQANNLIIDDRFSKWLTGIYNSTLYSATGDTGLIDIRLGENLELYNSAKIYNFTSSLGNANGVKIKAQNIKIDNYSVISSIAASNSFGDAGFIDLDVDNLIELYYAAEISSGTFGEGDAGDIKINTKNLKIDAQNNSYTFTGIGTNANYGSLGDAGDINIKVDNLLELYDGAEIASNTFSVGDAGNINITANDIYIDGGDIGSSGILSGAQVDSSGLVGNINIDANNLELYNKAEVSISNFGNLSEKNLLENKKSELNINVNNIILNRTFISADSTGNAPSSDINIYSRGTISIENSVILTSANTNTGGDIFINSGVLFMKTGFIQANTSFGESGGNIYIDSNSIITKKSIAPLVGGQKQDFFMDSGLNVIQAAAPQGNPGNLNIISPKLDLTSSLAKLSTHYVNISELIKNPCSKTSENESSLVSR